LKRNDTPKVLFYTWSDRCWFW